MCSQLAIKVTGARVLVAMDSMGYKLVCIACTKCGWLLSETIQLRMRINALYNNPLIDCAIHGLLLRGTCSVWVQSYPIAGLHKKLWLLLSPS